MGGVADPDGVAGPDGTAGPGGMPAAIMCAAPSHRLPTAHHFSPLHAAIETRRQRALRDLPMESGRRPHTTSRPPPSSFVRSAETGHALRTCTPNAASIVRLTATHPPDVLSQEKTAEQRGMETRTAEATDGVLCAN